MDNSCAAEKIFALLDQWRKCQPEDKDLVPILQTALDACGRKEIANILKGTQFLILKLVLT